LLLLFEVFPHCHCTKSPLDSTLRPQSTPDACPCCQVGNAESKQSCSSAPHEHDSCMLCHAKRQLVLKSMVSNELCPCGFIACSPRADWIFVESPQYCPSVDLRDLSPSKHTIPLRI